MNLTLGGGGHRGSSSPPASRPAPSKPAAPPPRKPAAPPPSKPAAPPPSKPATTKSTPQTPSKPTVASSTGTARTSYVKPSGNSTPTVAQQNGHGSQDYLLDKATQKQQSPPPKKTETKQPTPPVVVKPPVKTGNSTPTVAQQNGYGSQDHMLDKATQGQQSPPRKKAETIESGPAKKSTVEPVVVTSLLPEIVRTFYTSATKAIEKAETEKGESLGAVIKKKTIEETKATQGRGDLSQNRDEVEKKGTQQTLGKANQTQIKFIEGRGNQDFKLSKEHAQLKLEENRLNRIISKSKLGKGELSLNIEKEDILKTKPMDKIKKYMKDSIQFTLNESRAERTTALGVAAQVVLGVLNLDLPLDIQKLVYDIHDSNGSEIGMDIVALFPVAGGITKGVKGTQKILSNIDMKDIKTVAKELDEIKGLGGKKVDEIAEFLGKTADDIASLGKEELDVLKKLLEDYYAVDGDKVGKKVAEAINPSAVVDQSADVAKQVENAVEGGLDGAQAMLKTPSANAWGTLADGTNQGIKHFNNYWELYPERIPSIANRLGVDPADFSNTVSGFENFTKAAQNIIDNPAQMRVVNGKSLYFVEGAENVNKGVTVIVQDGKIQSMMPTALKDFLKLK